MKNLLIYIAGALWLVGGNVLVAMHYRRRGIPWWSGFRPFAFPFGHFNKQEWLALLALFIAAMGLSALGFWAGE